MTRRAKPTIEIVAPRADWPAQFDAIAARLADAFGALAIRIEHIGSTSVPGLPAKDVIDVQVSVASLDLPDDISDRLSREGFTLLPGAWNDHVPCNAEPTPELWSKRYVRASVGARRVHVHIRRHGAPNERYALLFRDYLRTSPGAAGSYALIKQELGARHSEDADAYYAVKDPVCDLIMDAAERWATATDWDRTEGA
jgi:GrpB-like predicted nucleotidyltransferase (UPF0157 family)